MAEDNILVEINELLVNFYTYQGTVQAIEGIDLSILKGETLGLVGETGCGKSVTASTIMKLILSPPGKIEAGSIYFLEPTEVRARRRQLEAEAQASYAKLSPAMKKDLVAKWAPRYTGFKKRVRPLTQKDIEKLPIPDRAPHKYVTNYLLAKAKSIPKEDKTGRDAATKNFNLLQKSNEYMQKIRGRFISMIFQEPAAALNPVFTAGNQVAEVILVHRRGEMAMSALKRIDFETKAAAESGRPRRIVKLAAQNPDPKAKKKRVVLCSTCNTPVGETDSWCDNCGVQLYGPMSWTLRSLGRSYTRKMLRIIAKKPDIRERYLRKIPIINSYSRELDAEALRAAVKMLDVVRIPDPKGVAMRYPFELSGGMQQRVMIAMALACNPQLLIADEPTTALDVTIQGQILKLMRDLKLKYGGSILLITHNLGVVAEMCDRVGVMYAGSMAEIGPAKIIFKSPSHPYTMGLMKSVPSIQMEAEKLYTIRGSVPNLIYPPSGCRFHPRCDYAKNYCKKVKPELVEIVPGHQVSCHMVVKTEGYIAERT